MRMFGGGQIIHLSCKISLNLGTSCKTPYVSLVPIGCETKPLIMLDSCLRPRGDEADPN